MVVKLLDDGKERDLCEAQYNYEAQGTVGWAARMGVIGRDLEKRASDLPDRLRQSRDNGQLSLVVGAGLGLSCGLPGWGALVDDVFTRVLTETELDRVEARSLLKSVQFRSDPLALAQALTAVSSEDKVAQVAGDVLYQKTCTRSVMLRALAELIKRIQATARPNSPTVVVTFNYDILIEEELARLGVPVVSVGRGADVKDLVPNVVNVWHVHGVLPRKGSAGAPEIVAGNGSIVLTEASYGHAYLRSGNEPLTLLLKSGKWPFFVGFSFTDSYVRQILLRERLSSGAAVAVGLLADESLIDPAKTSAKSYAQVRKELLRRDASINQLRGAHRRVNVRTETIRELPAWFARWMLDSVGVEWYRVKSFGAVGTELENLAQS